MQKTKVIKVVIGKEWSLRKAIKHCNETVQKASTKILETEHAEDSHYAMSELVELKPAYAKYKITLISNLELVGKSTYKKKVKQC